MALNLDGLQRKKTTLNLHGRDFVFTELSIADIASFEAWYKQKRKESVKQKQQEVIELVNKLGEAGLGDFEPMELLREVAKDPTDEEIENSMTNDTESVGRLAYYSLKYHYPEISPEEAARLVTVRHVNDILKAMMPQEAMPEAMQKKMDENQDESKNSGQ